jgi:hypothetical protein
VFPAISEVLTVVLLNIPVFWDVHCVTALAVELLTKQHKYHIPEDLKIQCFPISNFSGFHDEWYLSCSMETN